MRRTVSIATWRGGAGRGGAQARAEGWEETRRRERGEAAMMTLYQKIFTFCQRTSKSRSLMSLCTSTTAQNAVASSNQFRSCALGHPQHLLLLNLRPYKEQNCAGRQIQCRALSLDEHNYRTQGKTADTEHFTAVYRFQGIRFFRAISKFKLVQTGITIALLPPVYYFYLQGLVQCSLVSYITGLSGFAIVMLYSMSYYLRRFIGMLYLNDSGTMLMVSHLTFWGSRNDFYVPVKDVVPLGDTGDATSETILQFRRFNSMEVFYFTIKFGQVIDKQKFLQVFGCIQ